MANEFFMSICPRSKEYTGWNITGIPVKVIQSDGVTISPHIKFTENNLSNGDKYFHNNSGNCDSFTVKVMINEEDTVQGKIEKDNPIVYSVVGGIGGYRGGGKTTSFQQLNVITMLDYFIRKGEPFYVTTRAVGIDKNELWLVTENKSRKQQYDDGYVEWDLTFTKWVSYTYASFQNTNKAVTNALNKYKKKQEDAKKKKEKEKKAKEKTTAKYKLQHKCKASQLKYSKNKKVVTCVKYMQQILYNKKFLKNKSDVDGWYGKVTKEALKGFQKKYKDTYKCKTDGNVDKNTFKALYSV